MLCPSPNVVSKHTWGVDLHSHYPPPLLPVPSCSPLKDSRRRQELPLPTPEPLTTPLTLCCPSVPAPRPSSALVPPGTPGRLTCSCRAGHSGAPEHTPCGSKTYVFARGCQGRGVLADMVGRGEELLLRHAACMLSIPHHYWIRSQLSWISPDRLINCLLKPVTARVRGQPPKPQLNSRAAKCIQSMQARRRGHPRSLP